ncbi:MAG: pentapeptide repeat-containing protein, partial [Chloroflexota bacterium]
MQRILKQLLGDRTNLTVLLILVAITLATSISSALVSPERADPLWWSGWLQNFSTEMSGAIATFLLFEIVVGTQQRVRERKRQIRQRLLENRRQHQYNVRRVMRELRSNNAEEGARAVDEAKEMGIFHDGTIKGADLKGANLAGADLSGLDLSGFNLREINLSGADLTNVRLSGADLIDADLSYANLIGVQCTNSNLRFANLSGADLRNAELLQADLSHADLSGDNLMFANLFGANLFRAELQGADLRGTWFDAATILPDADKSGSVTKSNYSKFWKP